MKTNFIFKIFLNLCYYVVIKVSRIEVLLKSKIIFAISLDINIKKNCKQCKILIIST